MTRDRVAQNVKKLVALTGGLGVPADKAGDYLAYRNIFYGLGG